jgi:hypothetical protein
VTLEWGDILSQQSAQDQKLHPCAFLSHRLNPAEKNYNAGNRELLAVKMALEEWRHWLEQSSTAIRQRFWWPTMVPDVSAFGALCTVCVQNKIPQQAPSGLLQPLPVPGRPWSHISLDFVTGSKRKIHPCQRDKNVVDL